MPFANIWATVGEHIGTFGFGVLVGLVLASRYRIVRIMGTKTNGDAPPPP